MKKSGGTSRKMKAGTPGHKVWDGRMLRSCVVVHNTWCVLQSSEVAVVFKSYDKSSGISLRSSKVQLAGSWLLHVLACILEWSSLLDFPSSTF